VGREKMVVWDEGSGKGGMEVFGYDITCPVLARDMILHGIA